MQILLSEVSAATARLIGNLGSLLGDLGRAFLDLGDSFIDVFRNALYLGRLLPQLLNSQQSLACIVAFLRVEALLFESRVGCDVTRFLLRALHRALAGGHMLQVLLACALVACAFLTGTILLKRSVLLLSSECVVRRRVLHRYLRRRIPTDLHLLTVIGLVLIFGF